MIIGVHNKKKKKFPYQKLSTSGVGHSTAGLGHHQVILGSWQLLALEENYTQTLAGLDPSQTSDVGLWYFFISSETTISHLVYISQSATSHCLILEKFVFSYFTSIQQNTLIMIREMTINGIVGMRS